MIITRSRLETSAKHIHTQEAEKMCSLEKKGNLFILTLTGDDEHRLNPTLIDSIRSALRRVRSESTGPSALITTAHGKFFSNGYDLAWAQSDRSRLSLMSSKLRSLVGELISFPMPTIAAVSGHAAAAGFILALAHDYVLMRRDRGFVYMSEVDIGLVLPDYFVTLIKCKVGSPTAVREMVLKAAKLTADEAVRRGIIDSAHDSAEKTLRAAVELGEWLVGRKWDGNVYGQNRMSILGDAIKALRFDESVETKDDGSAAGKLSKL